MSAEQDRIKITRRQALKSMVTITGAILGAEILTRLKIITKEDDPEMAADQFREKTEELFESLSRNPKSELINYGQNGIGYKITASPSGERVDQLTITKGQIATKLRSFHPPQKGAFMLEIEDGAGYYELISFSKTVPPSRFYPAPAIDAENGIYDPVKMESNEMTDFLRKAAYIANSA